MFLPRRPLLVVGSSAKKRFWLCLSKPFLACLSSVQMSVWSVGLAFGLCCWQWEYQDLTIPWKERGLLIRILPKQLIPGTQGPCLLGQAGTACECKQYLSAARMKGQLGRRAHVLCWSPAFSDGNFCSGQKHLCMTAERRCSSFLCILWLRRRLWECLVRFAGTTA